MCGCQQTNPTRKHTLNVLVGDWTAVLCTTYNCTDFFCTTHDSLLLYFSKHQNHHNFYFFQNKTYFISITTMVFLLLMKNTCCYYYWCRCHCCFRCFDGDLFWAIHINQSVFIATDYVTMHMIMTTMCCPCNGILHCKLPNNLIHYPTLQLCIA